MLGTKFITEKVKGVFTRTSKQRIRKQLNAFSDDCELEFSIREVKKGGYTATRYKYYFSGLLPSIFSELRNRYAYRVNGKLHRPKTLAELHEFLVAEFNSILVIDKDEGTVGKETQSTRGLSDYEFIGLYMESIMSLAAMPPYNCNIFGYEEWKEKYEKKRSYLVDNN